MSCQDDIHVILLKDRYKTVAQICDLRLIGMLCGTVDILVQSHDPPLAVRVCSYCLLNELFVLAHVRILCVQDDEQRVAVCKIVIAAHVAVIAEAA